MGRVKTHTIFPVRCFDSEGNELFEKRTVREILKINHVQTLNEYLEILDIPKKSLKWSDIKQVLEMQLFLRDRQGGNTKQMYRILKQRGAVDKYFKAADIDLNAEFDRVQRRYHSKHPLGGNVAYKNVPVKTENRVPAMV